MLGFDLALTSKYKHYEQDFIDQGRIGAGGFARVHRVRSKLDNRQYAIKIVEIKPSQCKEDIIQTMHKFLEQVKILSYLNHKHVLQYYGCWVQGQLNSIEQIPEPVEEEVEQSNQIYMVMQEDFQSGGIEFACSENDSGAKSVQKNRNSSVFQNQKEKAPVSLDHSEASANIRQKYKMIRIFILSQLCQKNVQSYLYQRNLAKKNLNFHRSNDKDQLMQNYKMIIQIIEGLQYLHSKKIIHRDIKLHNIVLDKQNKCKIIDYGLAKKARLLNSISEYPKEVNVDDQNGQQIFSSSVGTRIFSSPEQITSQKYDHRTDIYSLAIVILLFFSDFTTTHEELTIIERIRKIDLEFIQCDQRLKKILVKCLGQEKNRPRLTEIKKVVRTLLRERYERQSKQLPENSLPYNQNAVQKQSNIYIFENAKLKRKISKDQFMSQNISPKQSPSSFISTSEDDLSNLSQSLGLKIRA